MTDAPLSLVMAESFGSTFQGEGPSTGRVAYFLRTGGCNLACSWCDTPYTWDARRFDLRAEMRRVPVADLLAAVDASGAPLVVITGGEPLLHQAQPGWRTLLHGLEVRGLDVEVETNGTVAPSPATAWRVTRFNVSPKLAHSGDPEEARIRLDALAALHATGKAVFKFVCREPADVDDAARLATSLGVPPAAVWVMPEGATPDAITATARALVDATLAHGFNLTTRLHVYLWPHERSR